MNTKKPVPVPNGVYQLRVELEQIEPLIWRRILVPATTKLSKLDRIVQAAMGWTNSHLHEWQIGGHKFGRPDVDWANTDLLDERKFTMAAVLGDQIKSFGHAYDYGDGWEHRITVEEQLTLVPGQNDWAVCLAGENACPPEDVGGPSNYPDFIATIRNTAHPQHQDCWRWWGGPFDPQDFSVNAANLAIRKLR